MALVLVMLMCGPLHAAADPKALAAAVQAQLKPQPVLRGRFVQERTLQGFAKPLTSTGDFLVARGLGVLWQTRTPFPTRLLVTPDAVRESAGDGEDFQLTSTDEPALARINELLLAVLQGELQSLDERFELSGAVAADGTWTVTLKPRGEVAVVLAEIRLTGAASVATVEIDEASGDRSRIVFQDVVAGPPLEEGEAALFAPRH